MVMKRKTKKKWLFEGLLISFVFIMCGVFAFTFINQGTNEDSQEVLANPYLAYNTKDFKYLSDIPYDKEQSTVAWRTIYLDKNSDGELISLNIDGKRTYFMKGIFAHANSTVIYDIREYNTYDIFTAYVGVDASRRDAGDGVRFNIYTSMDGTTWDQKYQMDKNIKGNDNAIKVEVPINGVNYLKLEATRSGSETSDHAVYANAKLALKDYVEDTKEVDFIHPVSYYDETLKSKTIDSVLADNELLLLQRTLVNRVGYDLLQAFARYSDENEEVLRWLFNDVDCLRMYITGGKPVGNYIESLKVIVELYQKYKDDISTGSANYQVYRTMFFALSLTHSTNVCLWISGTPCSDAVTRYQIYKDLYQQDLLETKIFSSLSVEEMRWVVNSLIDDEEIKWLNAHARKYPIYDKNGNKTSDYNLDPYKYITYGQGYNYLEDQYYDDNNYNQWNEKYDLETFGVTYRKGQPKLWIVMEEGSVCGGISKLGANLRQVFGVPSAVIGQPGHAAYLVYNQNQDGQGTWGIYNDVSGWTKSEKGERMLNDWGSTTSKWNSYYQVSYVLLAQSALNDYDSYEEAEEILLLEEVYANDYTKLEEVYRKALDIEPINIDAWRGLIKTYEWDHTKTSKDYYDLASDIAKNLANYPLPMYDLFQLIKTNITQKEYIIKFDSLLDTTLRKATQITDADYIQSSATRTMANYLLGNSKFELATFSFDGENANTIVLAEQYQDPDSSTQYRYCLDGLNNSDPDNITCNTEWTNTNDKKRQLTPEELAKISTENGISIQIVGSSPIYTIDIIKPTMPTNLYANDLENKVIGVTDKMEWQKEGTTSWTSFIDAQPDLSGDTKVSVRIGKTGTYLESDSATFAFSEDTNTETEKYISIDRLSLAGYSSEEKSQRNDAKYAIDGNIKTIWHTLWNGSDTEKYITIKVDTPVYLSKIQYVPRQDASNGKIKNAQILVSMDGENWEEVVESTTWDTSSSTKEVTLAESVLAQYVKIVGKETVGSYASAALINLFEDTTKEIVIEPTPEPTPSPEETLPPSDSNDNDDNDSQPEPSVTPMPTPTPTPTPVPTPTQDPLVGSAGFNNVPTETEESNSNQQQVETNTETSSETSEENTEENKDREETKEEVKEETNEQEDQEQNSSWINEDYAKPILIAILAIVAFIIIF